MREYVECVGCEFVYVAADGTEPAPKNRCSCPNCEGVDFSFLLGM